jgi:hypothetical protein
MYVVKAPYKFSSYSRPYIFLAGSIEMGKAEDWQSQVCSKLSTHSGTILNPRRDNWDSSWEQTIENLQFKEQVNWELNAQEQSDLIIMNFIPGTQSPISLLELGLFSHMNMLVLCPDGFWRKGNVDIVCDRYNIQQVNNLDQMFGNVFRFLEKFQSGI